MDEVDEVCKIIRECKKPRRTDTVIYIDYFMTILAVNTGSSSIRLDLFKSSSEGLLRLASRQYRVDEGTPEKLLRDFLHGFNVKTLTAVGHRVVHGGMRFVASCIVDDEVEDEIERLSHLAPLHNPIALKWIQTCRNILGPDVPQVAVFDTAFYSVLPEIARIYALPKDLCHQHEIRRYGFHGIAHCAMVRRWQELRRDLEKGGRVISIQLGSGCSITAVKNGTPVDTSMGFSPIEGLMMATRSGDIDPGIIIYLQRLAGLTAQEVDKLLNKSSGLLGVSGISDDIRALLESEHSDARLALSLYCYRARKYIGAYMAALGGVDGILFGGGVGENAPVIRERILEDMDWLGIELDRKANNATIGKEGRISLVESKIAVWVIPVDEASVIAHEAVNLLK